jgi:hypothetical protein
MTAGQWFAASTALGRDVPITEAYPHICGRRVAFGKTKNRRHPVSLRPRDCAACAQETAPTAPARKPSTPDTRRPEPMHSNETMLDVALGAAARGWHIFPLRPDDKRPAFPNHPADGCTRQDPRCRAGHVGWEDRATTDADRIRRGWTSVPYGVGIACGPSGDCWSSTWTRSSSAKTRPPAWAGKGVDHGGIVLRRPVSAGRTAVPVRHVRGHDRAGRHAPVLPAPESTARRCATRPGSAATVSAG